MYQTVNAMKILLAALLCLLVCGFAPAQTFEKQGDRGWLVKTGSYKARINSTFGFLESLVMGGVEVIENKYTAVIYGYYKIPGLVYIADSVERKGNSILSVNNNVGSVEYVFERSRVVIKVTNNSGDDFFQHTILSRAFTGAVSETGYAFGMKGGLRPGAYTLLSPSGAVHISGDASVFDTSVLCALRFAPEKGAVATETISPALFDEGLKKKAFELRYPAADDETLAPIVLNSPTDWQVFQRTTKREGVMRLSGRVNVPFDKVFYRISGKSADGKQYPGKWEPVPVNKAVSGFDAPVPLRAGGWYIVDVKAEYKARTVARVTVRRVGMGEVFIGAGQSNATNSSPDRTRTQTGMVSCTDGRLWQPADDPIAGVHDGSDGGSCYPAFGDALYRELGVPVGIAAVGHGGTAVADWRPDTELYGYFMNRVRQLGKGGFRAVLWHQGENDAWTPSEDYYRQLRTSIRYSCLDAGWRFPWFVAKVSYHSPSAPFHETTRSAQQRLWDEGIALPGPDTDQLQSEYIEAGGMGIHFSEKGLKAHGEAWAE
ncbi:MAG: hypothetical protein IJT95_05780, partial [Abditibacteriota bacterium]|nr:hypothetical protein [Abditibacteriota bacterium]